MCYMKNNKKVEGWKSFCTDIYHLISRRSLEITMAILLLVSMVILSRSAAKMVSGIQTNQEKLVVVIDAGHGGNDPGKIGVNGAVEKDINLIVAKKLENLLKANDIEVVMTRTSDKGNYSESDTNKKVADMKARLALIDESKPVLVVSIHQNSYPDESVKGAQVFYYETSQEGKEIAELFQAELVSKLDPTNHRLAKGNTSYYLLKKTASPIVIVECGFLSNWKEAESLATDEYQERVAWAIHMGVMKYVNGLDKK